jgi:hypothetical protein
MAGTLTFLGKKSLSAAIPVLAQLAAAIDIDGQAAKLAGLIKLNARLAVRPPSVGGNIALAAKIAAAANVAITPPSVSFSLDLQIAKLQLLVNLLLEIGKLLVAAGIHLYAYEGDASGLAEALQAEFTPGPSQGGVQGTENVYAVILLIEASGQITVKAVKRTFGTP